MNRQEIEAALPDGYVLISPEKANTATPLHLKCPRGHSWTKARIGNIKNNKTRCPTCKNIKQGEQTRFDQEEAAGKMESLGWKLLTEYTGSHSRVDIECLRCGLIRKNKVFYNIPDTGGKCFGHNQNEEATQKINDRIKELGAELLFIEEKNGKVRQGRLGYICNERHKPVHTTYRKFIDQKQICRACKGLQIDLDYVKANLKKGYTFLEGHYINNMSKTLKLKCPNGHEYVTSWHSHDQYDSGGCKICSPTAKFTDDKVIERLERYNLRWVEGSYINIDSPLKLSCANDHHPFFIKSIRQVQWSGFWPCEKCQDDNNCKSRSNGEKKMAEFVASLNLNEITNDRKLIKKEIDVLIPDKKFGIEFCGLYYHNESMRGRTHHIEKYDLAKQNNHKIFFLYEDEWHYREEQVKNYIKRQLFDYPCLPQGSCQPGKCKNSHDIDDFIDTHSIQGVSNVPQTKYTYYLKHGHHGVVAGLVVRIHPINKVPEVDRFVIHNDFTIDSFDLEELFDFATHDLFNHGDYKKLICYIERRYPNHDFYDQFFTQERLIEAHKDFDWVKNMQRKSSSHKTDIKGWNKIFGCGKKVMSMPIPYLSSESFCKKNHVKFSKVGEEFILKWEGDKAKVNNTSYKEACEMMRKIINVYKEVR